MKDSFLVMHQTPKHIEYSSGSVEETCDVEFDESNGSQEEVVGYDNVGDEEIEEALKKMSIGDIKLEEVHEGNDQGGGPSSSTPSTSMAPQMDEDKEKDDSQSQERSFSLHHHCMRKGHKGDHLMKMRLVSYARS